MGKIPKNNYSAFIFSDFITVLQTGISNTLLAVWNKRSQLIPLFSAGTPASLLCHTREQKEAFSLMSHCELAGIPQPTPVPQV